MKLLVIFCGFFYLTTALPLEKELKSRKDSLYFDPDKILDDHLKFLLKRIDSVIGNNINTTDELIHLLIHIVNSKDVFNLIYEIKKEWTSFKLKFGKIYSNLKEEAKRFLIFMRNYIKIKSHNDQFKAGAVKFTMSVNHLSDLNDKEYSSLLGLKFVKSKNHMTYLSPLTKVDLPNQVDWRSTAVTPVKDQGNCGSCWAFSTTGSLEGQHYRKTKQLVSLSEQQLVDCSMENFGCGGGLMDKAFEYIKMNGGIDTEKSYPYISGKIGHKSATCNFSVNDIGATVSGFIDISSGDEDLLKEAVALVGPISVGIDASHMSFRSYHSGVYEEPLCNSQALDHGVLVVGYGVDSDLQIPYWLVKNSWNTTWGDSGYIKMKRNANNMCGIATAASYPLV